MAILHSFLTRTLFTCIAFGVAHLKVCMALTATSDPWVTAGLDTTITCSDLQVFTFFENQKSAPSVTDVDDADTILRYENGMSIDTATYYNNFDPNHYTFQESGGNYLLTVKSVTLDDAGRYWCYKIVVPPPSGGSGKYDASSVVQIRVPPSLINIAYDGTSHDNGNFFPVVAGAGRQITCTSPAVNPATTFTWTLPASITTDQPLGSQTNTTNSGDSRLTDSTNTITVDIAETPATAQLTCGATNSQDGSNIADMSITVTLQVRVPPKAVKLSDSDGEKTPGATVPVNQGSSHTFSCLVQGTRPAATIQWFVDDVMPSTGVGTPTSTETNELFDTTGTWTFTPSRANHRQEVKCVANTAESQQPHPYLAVTLDVNGPPDTPTISGNTVMTENVMTSLTCTADMGYPDDWTLVWSNGGSPGPTTNPSASGDRYSFTSTLNYEPVRDDNGNNITCTANRSSWTPGPVGSLGPIDVQFCTTAVSVQTCPPEVNEKDSLSLTCVTESSNPATTLTWSKNDVDQSSSDQPNDPGDHGGSVTRFIYTIDVLNKSNNGDVLKCCSETTSSCTATLCDVCTLNVKYPPVFTSLTPTPQTPVTEGSDVTLTCTVDANPSTVDITWKQEGRGDAFNPTNGLTSTLSLSNIRREDAGYYTCTANNSVPTEDTKVVSSQITVIVHYEVNITNKAMNEVGVKNGDTAVLVCIAEGNPEPVMEWYGPNTTGIISDTDEEKFLITNETSGGDGIFEFKVTSKLTIKAVDSRVDYGVYTCTSSNNIGKEDSLNITLNGTRRPDKPTRVEITEQTAKSLTVTWTAGYDGGETQSFRVSCIKTSDSTEVFTEDTDGKTTSTATGLDGFTEYEIRVYAKNAIGESIGYGSTREYTLPNPPGPDSGITVKYNKQSGTVEVEGLNKGNGCIQLEVQYEGNDAWQKCGACIESDQTVTLSEWCASSQKRRRRAVGDIVAVQSKYCFGTNGRTCSEPADPEIVIVKPTNAPLRPDIGLIVGATLGGLVLITIIVVLIVYLVRTSPKKRNSKEDSFSPADDIRDVELQEQSHDVQPEENNGITNEALLNNVDEEIPKKKPEKNEEPDAEPTEEDGLEADTTKGPIPVKRYTVDSGDTYAQVNKTKLPPKPQSARSAPTNLPDVTYAEVNKDKKPKPPHDDYAAKKKPKKYVPPSSRAAEESAYEEVQISDKDKAQSPPAADSADTYASVGGQQDTSGRVVTEDGLIYAEVGHMKQHPVDQPPIQTEESTEYASLDFARMKPEDK